MPVHLRRGSTKFWLVRGVEGSKPVTRLLKAIVINDAPSESDADLPSARFTVIIVDLLRCAQAVKKQIATVLALLTMAAPAVALAEQSLPYSCQWVSEVTPDAVIRFTGTNGVGTYNGALFYKGKRLMNVQEGQSMGYGSNWWGTEEQEDPSGTVVVFAGNQVVRGTPGWMDGSRPAGPQRLLLVGLGSSLWYGNDPSWREQAELLAAGEGFWRSMEGCRTLL